MKRHLLILGGGQMQLPAMEWAHKMGLAVVCFDGNPEALARETADYFVLCDISQPEACVEKAREHRALHRLDGVLTVGTDFSTTVAWVAQALNLPGLPYEVTMRAKDKGLMRACFAQQGVSSPQYVVRQQGLDEPGELPSFGLPCVAKPSDSMGARGVRLVSTVDELTQAVIEAWAHSPTGRCVVEEFIDGPEFSLDAIVIDGVLHRMGLADRHIIFSPFFVEIGHSFPSSQSPAVVEALWSEFERAVRAIGITNGAAKGDVKLSKSGPRIGEVAARLSGGYMSGWTYPLSSGRSATLWAIELALGDAPSPQSDDRWGPVVERAWISLPGVIRAVHGIEAIKSLPGVLHVFVGLKPGRRMLFPRNNVEKAGNILCSGTTRQEAEETARTARNGLVIELEPHESSTDAFLWGADDGRWWFDRAAYRSQNELWTLSTIEAWRDPYGNSVEQLLGVLGLNSSTAPKADARFTRAFFKGGAQGVRYLGVRPAP